MSQASPPSDALIRNISDTAMWAAVYRARETERADHLFSDPFARRLAGTRGEQIAKSLAFKMCIRDSSLHFDVATGERMFFPANLFTGVNSAIPAAWKGYTGSDCAGFIRKRRFAINRLALRQFSAKHYPS